MIHLGYAIPTGEPVSIPLRHTAVTGQSQEAGKTTALEALISRSGLRALTFVTKRGESAFQDAREIRPYFRERADWQYVAAILEATLREKLKFERSWIMKVCKGAESLADVQANVEKALEKARGLNESILTTLHAYLELVLPQISRTDFARSVQLHKGVNVMDLSDFRLEMQSLIIRSAVEWVYEREENTIVIIPEAWEFIPQQRGSPVKLAVEQLIRKGAACKNYVWLDSQDIAGVHKDILRQVPVWLLGVQREKNEVKRTLSHMSGLKKPSVDDVMQLGLGEFFVCYAAQVLKVYVQPAWMTEATARSVADGTTTADQFRVIESPKDDESMWKEKYEALKADHDGLAETAESLTRRLNEAERTIRELTAGRPAAPAASNGNGHMDLEEVYRFVRQRIIAEKDPGVMEVIARRPELRVKIERAVVEVDESSLRGRLARLLAEGFFDSTETASAAYTELRRRGVSVAKPSVYAEMDKLTTLGIVTKEAGEGYRKSPDAIIKKSAA